MIMAEESIEEAPKVNETEEKARRVGWVPKEEFRGDPDRHVTAAEFLARSESLMPLLRRDNDKLHKRVQEMEGILRETRDAQKEFLEHAGRAEQRAYEKARAEWQAHAEAAAANADQAGVRHAINQMEALERPIKPQPRPAETRPAGNPIIQDWIDREERWFKTSHALNGYATDTFGELEREHPGMPVEEMLAETKRRTMEKFPEKFGINPRRDAPPAVGSPTGRSAPAVKANAKVFSNLPEDVKAQFPRAKKSMPTLTEEEFASYYQWDD
jgi:hypothetical protein